MPRPDTIGRHILATAEPSKTIAEFCESEGISKSKYYKMKKAGTTPDEMRVDGIIRITPMSHAKWRSKHTSPPPKPTRHVRELPRGRVGSSP